MKCLHLLFSQLIYYVKCVIWSNLHHLTRICRNIINPINTLLLFFLHLLSQKEIQFENTGRLSCCEPGKRFWLCERVWMWVHMETSLDLLRVSLAGHYQNKKKKKKKSYNWKPKRRAWTLKIPTKLQCLKSKEILDKHRIYIYFNGKAFMLKESIQLVLLRLLVCTFTTVLQIFFSAPVHRYGNLP